MLINCRDLFSSVHLQLSEGPINKYIRIKQWTSVIFYRHTCWNVVFIRQYAADVATCDVEKCCLSLFLSLFLSIYLSIYLSISISLKAVVVKSSPILLWSMFIHDVPLVWEGSVGWWCSVVVLLQVHRTPDLIGQCRKDQMLIILRCCLVLTVSLYNLTIVTIFNSNIYKYLTHASLYICSVFLEETLNSISLIHNRRVQANLSFSSWRHTSQLWSYIRNAATRCEFYYSCVGVFILPQKSTAVAGFFLICCSFLKSERYWYPLRNSE